MVIAVKQHNSLNIAKMKEIKGYLEVTSEHCQVEEHKDWYRKMTCLAFYLWIFSLKFFFLEVFKCINYYYVFALTVLLPKMKIS